MEENYDVSAAIEADERQKSFPSNPTNERALKQ